MANKISPQKAALLEAASAVGGQAALAKALGFANRSCVWPWFNTGRQVPAEYCPTIERLAREGGKRVLCEQIRPDVEWAVLRKKA